jgi:hypothetical protein
MTHFLATTQDQAGCVRAIFLFAVAVILIAYTW